MGGSDLQLGVLRLPRGVWWIEFCIEVVVRDAEHEQDIGKAWVQFWKPFQKIKTTI